MGLLYCSGEPNSVYQVEVVSEALTGMGYTCANFAFTDVNDLASVTQSACDSSDVIYIPTDNTAANNTEAIANVVILAGVPVVAGEEGICSGCGVVTLSISYYDIGVYITYRILDVADLTVDGSLATGGAPAYCWPSTASTSGSPPCAPFWPGCWRDWSPACSTPGAGSPPSWPGS